MAEDTKDQTLRLIPEESEGAKAESPEKPPPDAFGLAWFIMLMLGIGVLFPWDAFITAFDYFDYLWPHFPFEFGISLAYNYPSIVFLLLSVKFGPKFSISARIVTAFTVDFLILLSIPLLTVYANRDVSLWFTLAGTFATGCSTAVLFGSVLGLAALFPPSYTGAVMSGNGVAGLATAALRIITKSSLPASAKGLEASSKIYFWLAASTILLCIISYFILLRLPFTKYHMDHYHRLVHQMNREKKAHKKETAPLMEEGSPKLAKTSITIVFWKIWPQALNVFAVFFVTLALFPGVTSLVKTNTNLGDWFGIIMITLFMIGDFLGRTAPRWFRWPGPKMLWILVFGRLVFFVLFILCIKPKVFESDYWAYSFMMLFAITNGYAGTLAMMYGPVNVHAHERESTGIMMSFFLNFGIFVAVHFALLLLFIITGSIGIQF